MDYTLIVRLTTLSLLGKVAWAAATHALCTYRVRVQTFTARQTGSISRALLRAGHCRAQTTLVVMCHQWYWKNDSYNFSLVVCADTRSAMYGWFFNVKLTTRPRVKNVASLAFTAGVLTKGIAICTYILVFDTSSSHIHLGAYSEHKCKLCMLLFSNL